MSAALQPVRTLREIRCPGSRPWHERGQPVGAKPCRAVLLEVPGHWDVNPVVLAKDAAPSGFHFVKKCDRCRSRIELQLQVGA